ncbi:MAG: DNA mismatch repair protein MutS, partial [Candidatus Muiribacteriota bacterium]
MDFDNLKLTPVMQQYVDIKKENLDSILFFRLGDFYEMFFDDAKIVSEELDLTLTARDKKSDNPIPMAGVPYHSASSYINKLIKKGYKVSICEQMSQPSAGKDIVKREVVKTITPGTLIEEDCFESDFNNYIMCLYQSNTNISIC